jgi:glutaredoxin
MNFTIYSKDGCPYCSKVEKVLNLSNLQYEVKKLDVDFNREDFYNKFGKGSTFPRVLLNDNLIGGCNETVMYLLENKII